MFFEEWENNLFFFYFELIILVQFYLSFYLKRKNAFFVIRQDDVQVVLIISQLIALSSGAALPLPEPERAAAIEAIEALPLLEDGELEHHELFKRDYDDDE